MVLFICERLAGCHNYRVSGVYSDRVEVFHVAHGNSGVVGVAHYLVLYLLVALYALLNQHLMNRGEGEGVFHHFAHFFRIVGKAASGSAEGKRGTKYDRVSYFFCGVKSFLNAVGYLRGDYRFADSLA